MSRELRRALIQLVLFIVTCITTTYAGAFWVSSTLDFAKGLEFSIPFILFLSAHEFGHYFTARYYKVNATLPYYIPFPALIGTLGAVIRLLSPVPSNKQNFDIGIAGPLAGFVVALAILFYGFTHLPPPEYIFQVHPEYKQYGLDYAKHAYEAKEGVIDFTIGKNLLFMFFENFVADPARVPNPHEVMHYPYLLAGFIALVVTFLNLVPIGQLDGGHVLYGLVGFKTHRVVASVFYIGFMFYAGLGNSYISPMENSSNELLLYAPLYFAFLYFAFLGLKWSKRDTAMCASLVFAAQVVLMYSIPGIRGYEGWLIFGFLIGRLVGVQHPVCEVEEPLNATRQILGWLTIIIFITCFSPAPIDVTVTQ